MKLEGLSYVDTCKIIQKVGAVYSSGFNPWVPFVRSDKCRLIRAEERGRGWGPAIDAASRFLCYLHYPKARGWE